MRKGMIWGKCIWGLGLLLLMACVRPARTAKVVSAAAAESAPSLTPATEAEPTPMPTVTASPLPPVEVLVTAVPTPTPTPTPAPFRAASIPADQRPARFLAATEVKHIFYWEAKDQYFAYGRVGNDKPGFYPVDEMGKVVPGTPKAEGPRLVPQYTPADPPTRDGMKLLVLYRPSQCVVAFHGENGEWLQDRVMICSSGKGENATPVGHYTIYERYEYKLLGSEEEDTLCFGFWACRFYKGHLFHSVPINYNAGYDKAKGHRMTNMRSYQKLGTPASHGCVRMTVADAKYIYDLSQFETVNVWVTKNNGPTPKKPPKINWSMPYTNKQGYGWDPTDPDPDNPYHASSAP